MSRLRIRYSQEQGPGTSGNGGGYGGQAYAGGGLYTITYGSYTAPTNLGSGGWNTAGGGAVILNVTKCAECGGKHFWPTAVREARRDRAELYLYYGRCINRSGVHKCERGLRRRRRWRPHRDHCQHSQLFGDDAGLRGSKRNDGCCRNQSSLRRRGPTGPSLSTTTVWLPWDILDCRPQITRVRPWTRSGSITKVDCG